MNWTKRLPFLLLLCALIAGITAKSGAQNTNSQQPAGGGTTSEAAAPNGTRAPKSTKTTPKSPATGSRSATTAAKPQSASAEKIDGRWWTSGNDFGKSAVVFTQVGNSVSGQISYADGRTGTLTGVFAGKRLNFSWTNSAGDQGTGWLEQSWTNFLGGPWRGRRVTNGSWTMNRIEGNWCFGGLRTRIRRVTHNAQGDMRYTTEDGERGGGHLDGPNIFLDDDEESLKGIMYYKANRIDFATGAYWTWCGR